MAKTKRTVWIVEHWIVERDALKARVLALETEVADGAIRYAKLMGALRRLREDCPVQACEGDWDPLFALLGEPPVR